MPPFPERESSILAKLKKKKGPGAVSVTELDDSKREAGELNGGADRGPDTAAMAASNAVSTLSLLFAKLSAFLFPLNTIFLVSSPPRHHQQTCWEFAPLLLSVPLRPMLAAYSWTCSLIQGLLHLLLL